jgi:hypothetical protein
MAKERALNAAFDYEDGICPPYWPEIVWWLLHHHIPIPDPGPDPGPIYDQLFSAVATFAMASRLQEKGAVRQVRTVALEQMRDAVESLGKAGFPSDEPGSPVGPRTRGQVSRG